MAARIITDQESPTRITLRIQVDAWAGVAEIGRIEVDIAKHLDRRVSITVHRLDESITGPVDVSVS